MLDMLVGGIKKTPDNGTKNVSFKVIMLVCMFPCTHIPEPNNLTASRKHTHSSRYLKLI